MYILEVSIYVHKNKQQLIAENNPIHGYNMRNFNVHLPSHRLNLTANSFVCKGVKIYNKLSSNIRELPTYQFKAHLKKILMNSPYYTLDEYFNDVVL